MIDVKITNSIIVILTVGMTKKRTEEIVSTYKSSFDCYRLGG